jgi:tryptophanyl-tRNA synthetase
MESRPYLQGERGREGNLHARAMLALLLAIGFDLQTTITYTHTHNIMQRERG